MWAGLGRGIPIAAPNHSSNNAEHLSVAFVYINYWEYLSHEKRIMYVLFLLSEFFDISVLFS
jgi:hypothetical protein